MRERSEPALDLVPIGRVYGAHGVRGHLRVRFLGDGPEHLLGARTLWLARAVDDPEPRRYEVRSTGNAGSADVRIELAGLTDREEALGYKGRWLLAAAAELDALEEDEFYWHQLIGCRVEAQGRTIGVVSGLMEQGSHDLLQIHAADGRQHLIPTAREFVTEIDLEARRIEVALIPGLIPDE